MKDMPSPLGHALGGVIAGGLLSNSHDRATLLLFALAGVLPDVDFLLPLPHRGPTHSVAAAAAVFVISAAYLGRRGGAGLRAAAAMACAYGSHILLDWLGKDTWTPHGLMVWWPITTAFYSSGWDLFAEINRRYWQPGFWSGNTLAVLREIAILLLPAALVVRHRQPRRAAKMLGRPR